MDSPTLEEPQAASVSQLLDHGQSQLAIDVRLSLRKSSQEASTLPPSSTWSGNVLACTRGPPNTSAPPITALERLSRQPGTVASQVCE
jgi:hypothetical protein